MISILRKIRKRLLTNGNFSSYLPYAIGEIALVVIGILIALQINNWNQERLNRIEEKEWLEALHKDFSQSKKGIPIIYTILNHQDSVMNVLLAQCGPQTKTLTQKEMDWLIGRMDVFPSFEAANGTLNNIIGSGKMNVLQNSELRQLLSRWHDKVDDLRTISDALSSFMTQQLFPYLETHVEYQYNTYVKLPLAPTQPFGIDSRQLLNDFRFCNLLKRGIYWDNWSKYKFQIVETDLDKIIELTATEK